MECRDAADEDAAGKAATAGTISVKVAALKEHKDDILGSLSK
jgi:hypothetical protein